jgi:hypothetical protein
MAEVTPPKTLLESILKTLLYYDLFRYPLTSFEVFQYLPTHEVTEEDVNSGLHHLADQSLIYRLGRFFSIQNNKGLECRRAQGNDLASKSLEVARKQSGRIATFPFVRGVLVSGSLAKGYMDADSDLDFFIITKPGRLWIARTLLVLYKRLFLFNSHKYFCVNYFVDSDHLEIEEKNLFTATELATLIPFYNAPLYRLLMQKNAWIKTFFPNYRERAFDGDEALPHKGVKKLSERCIDLLFTDRLEKWCKAITLRFWEKKYARHYSNDDFQIAFKTNDHASKNHPNNYQRKVMDRYHKRLEEFAMTNKLSWPA